jgi:uncharacterized membrane protein
MRWSTSAPRRSRRPVVAQDYEINLKAEVEIMALHEKLDLNRLGHLEVMLRDQAQRIEEL